MIALYAAIITLIVVVLIVLLALFLASRSKSSESDQSVIAGLYKIRTVYFALLMAIILVVLVITLPSQNLPYHETQTKKPEFIVSVMGKMWHWQITNAAGLSSDNFTIPLNKEVEFQVKAADVNHGFGIYTSGGQLLAQTQAMPGGYINRVRYVFKKPGVYPVMCMEFCGQAHHLMFSKLTVK